tara:strand:+ start:1068 stop:1646 length:579 start_codon:yes stop_codon:yes gene_type:complete
MTELLYKYRSLENFKNFIDIILKNRLYAAPYKDLNDPMEGQFYYNQGELNSSLRRQIRDEKGLLRICSLSRVNNNELMWSHYADGQRGIAIGVRIDNTEYDVRPVRYNGLAYIREQAYDHNTATEILTHKLEVWNYEQEERVFVRDQHFVNVTIESIVTGRRMSNLNISLVRELIEKINPELEILRADDILE